MVSCSLIYNYWSESLTFAERIYDQAIFIHESVKMTFICGEFSLQGLTSPCHLELCSQPMFFTRGARDLLVDYEVKLVEHGRNRIKTSHNTPHMVRRNIIIRKYYTNYPIAESHAKSTKNSEEKMPSVIPSPPIHYQWTTILGTWTLPRTDCGGFTHPVWGQGGEGRALAPDQEGGSRGLIDTITYTVSLARASSSHHLFTFPSLWRS